MDVLKGIQEIDEALVHHSVVRFNYTILNPINREEEFEKFVQDTSYNPQFRYNSFDVQYHIDGLEQLKIPNDHPLSELFEEIREDLLIEAFALKNIGTSRFSIEGIFPRITRNVIDEAKKILREPRQPLPKKNKVLSASDLAKQLQATLDQYDCRGWSIIFDRHANSRVSVSAGKKQITIREQEMFAQIDADKLIKHEIETHVLRSVNGAKQRLKVCAIGLPRYLATEEGLAMYNEGIVQPIPQEKFLRVARQVLISYYASKLSFSQTFKLVREYYRNDRTCFAAVLRAKRGLADTSRPGGYSKDHCYLQGYLEIKEYVAHGGDLKSLYAGKIALQHSYLVQTGLLEAPKVLPDFLQDI
jgi:uncharacterized protein (TIGR02421 family)